LVDGNGGALAGARICQNPPRPVKRYSHAPNEHAAIISAVKL
jgi:hypothetical protein